MDTDIGNLQRLSAREVFEHEAYGFTTWLEENIDALSNVIGIDLASAEREKTAGDFSADLLAEDESGRRIIVENQLRQTDHQHLGQVLTYLSVLDAEIAIWITADSRPEHVSAISWLNENAAGSDFYLVKVKGVQVDDSRPAPLFTSIVGPSPETRAAEQTKKEWDERDRVRYQFLSSFWSLLTNTQTGLVASRPRRAVRLVPVQETVFGLSTEFARGNHGRFYLSTSVRHRPSMTRRTRSLKHIAAR